MQLFPFLQLVFKSKARLLNDQLSSYSKVYAEVSETASLTLCLDRIMVNWSAVKL